jgi:hypothetical protein
MAESYCLHSSRSITQSRILCSNAHIKFGPTISDPMVSVRGQIGGGGRVKKREGRWKGENVKKLLPLNQR